MFKLKPCNVIFLLYTTMLLIASDHDTQAKPLGTLDLASKVRTQRRANYAPQYRRYLQDDGYNFGGDKIGSDNFDVEDTIEFPDEYPMKRKNIFVSF